MGASTRRREGSSFDGLGIETAQTFIIAVDAGVSEQILDSMRDMAAGGRREAISGASRKSCLTEAQWEPVTL